MAVISRASVQDLKLRVDIVDVVSSVVSLKRAGSKFKGLSPFNPEKTPSFFVSPDKGLFKCFSSGKAGDVITFVMETENLQFTEAVEALASRYNIPLKYEKGGISGEERSLRQQLMDLHEKAAEIYREAFLADNEGGAFIRDYWTRERKFSLEVAEDFKIGFADPGGCDLFTRLKKQGVSDDALSQCGLFFLRGSDRPLARFRGRLMIPIRDHQGRIVAFTARQLSVTPQDDPAHEAKYVNSPETPIFTKGNILFNLDRARKSAGPNRPFLMVEGQLDAIRCWSSGLTSAIAPQGTGITETQLQLLRRFHASVECLLDGDNAGQQAALRLLPKALQENLEIHFLPLPTKTDPDDLVREQGTDAIEQLRANRLSAMRFAVSALAPDPRKLSAQEMSDVCRELFAIVMQASSEVAKTEYLAEISQQLGLPSNALETDFRRFREIAARRRPAASQPVPEGNRANGNPEARGATFPPVETDLLLLLLHFEEYGEVIARAIDHEWIDKSTRAGRLLDAFLNDFEHDLWPGVQEIEQHVDDPEDRNFLASLLFERPAIEDPVKVANDGIRRIVSNFCGPKIAKNQLEIAAKQGNVDADILSLHKANEEFRRLKLNPPVIKEPA